MARNSFKRVRTGPLRWTDLTPYEKYNKTRYRDRTTEPKVKHTPSLPKLEWNARADKKIAELDAAAVVRKPGQGD